MRSCISVQLKKDEIWIIINEKAEEKEIMTSLKRKLVDLEKLYKEDKTPIKVKGKILKNKQIEEIRKLIKSKIDVDIEFESPTTLGLHGIKKTFNQEINSSETKFHRGSLRSGQRLEYEGSIVLIGDINAGAEVVAEEHIVVLGRISGLAHAGAKGNTKAIISANRIECPQIRIADKIKEFERQDHIYTYCYINEKDEFIAE